MASAAAVSGVRDFAVGNLKAKIRDVTFSSSYTTGGEALAPKDVGFRSIVAVIPCGAARKNDGTSSVNVSYDGSKLLAYWSAAAGAAPTEVTNATNLSTYKARVLILGTGIG